MKKVALSLLFLFALMSLASCGTELPDNLSNVEVNKDGGENTPSKPSDPGIPSEEDNPLPLY